MDHTETSSTPSERCRTLAKGGQKRISFPSALTPVVATQTWVGWAPTLPPPLDAATTDHPGGHIEPANQHHILAISNEFSDHCRCNVRVAFPHHNQTVSPTGKWAAVRTAPGGHLQAPNHRPRKTRMQGPAHPLEPKEFRGWCKDTSSQHCRAGLQTPLSNLV